MSLLHLYLTPVLSEAGKSALLSDLKINSAPDIQDILTEYCYNIEITGPLTSGEFKTLHWLLSETFMPENFSDKSFLDHPSSTVDRQFLLEFGPRMNFTTAWSTNAVSICHACGLDKVTRIERSRRYKLIIEDKKIGSWEDKEISTSQPLNFLTSKFLELIHDRMTECLYPEPLSTFETGVNPEPVFEVPLKEKGRSALEEINREMGLGLDNWDIDYYYNLFVNDIGRNPTNVECFDLSQSNSEHSRHWFFKGRLIVDGKEVPRNLMDIIRQPLDALPGNSIIAFKDNSSAIRGFDVPAIVPDKPGEFSRFKKALLNYHIILTAETHNFPSGVAPFPGAETGTGGRIRDIQAVGRGGLVIAGTAAYCVGNLRVPGYELPWEDNSFRYPDNLASPLEIEIQASNGASDYGNKFGEPVIQGYTRSFGMRLPNRERSEWIKPIMFTGGIGQMDARQTEKEQPKKGMLVVKIGGPAYRIGIGGGAASSMIQGENIAELDFNAVQRGDAEMEQKLNRVIRACIEMGGSNPIVSIHDQGAGGNCNVVKEIIYPAGAKIDVRKIQLGDRTLSVLEIWGAEYQEQNALLIKPEAIGMFEAMCLREKVPYSVIGSITGDGYIVLHDETDGSTPVDLSLEKILGDMPQKTFHLDRIPPENRPLQLPENIDIKEALARVLRLVSVGSKRFLTNKVDRSVSGLIAQQQCTGPLQLTVSDAAVVSQSHFGSTGSAISIGEQPIKALLDPSAMARMTVAEALTNIIWAKITGLEDIKCSANWMWAAKLPGEGARLYDAAIALSDIMTALGIAIDGGKDSLSMAAQVPGSNGETETVKSPPALVISAYAPCPDITKVITPDIKRPGQSKLIYIDLGNGKNRLGGSALAQVYSQIGNESPDMDDPGLLKHSFNAVQELIANKLILAGHDRSDGGLIVTLLEMAFAGNCGIDIELTKQKDEGRERRDENNVISLLFSEEAGLVMEYLPEDEDKISEILKKENVPFKIIGKTLKEKNVKIALRNPHSEIRTVLNEDMRVLRDTWEETSYQLERLQVDPKCAEEERKSNFNRKGPGFTLSFTPEQTPAALLEDKARPRVAIVREEGSNSDREMTSAFYQAGFEPWDVTMTDFLENNVSLSDFRGIAFVGGFSYADVLDSAKGWAGVIKFNEKILEEFRNFYSREDTFSLGVCNGCQLMALLGWVPWQGIENELQPRFIQNVSGRFESRFSAVKILASPSIMLRGMEDSVLGIWVAHGEGRAYFPDNETLKKVEESGLAPVRYVNDNNEITTAYPFNPNGAINGIAGLCSADGRHLAIMPHPERTFLKWQWPWMPDNWRKHLTASPWLRMFQNARQWCVEKK
ncbi:phosphoribosylformylglycinamidine synthase [bacterium BMS3Abin10]|nr:phosphoribosylformylglycinamidine synthase [bacterium BMS3Abin10]GBE38332.1 phosphoribosylformylglycinamidine synthase [bacterium BMS3Bbin08]HDH51444.1 phosphoribosylformylglycinamidine synthase [Nitrospirota bacterium]